jgi:hypothetical protein
MQTLIVSNREEIRIFSSFYREFFKLKCLAEQCHALNFSKPHVSRTKTIRVPLSAAHREKRLRERKGRLPFWLC